MGKEKRIMYKGVLHTYKTLSEELGIPVRVLRQRIYKHGVHKAVKSGGIQHNKGYNKGDILNGWKIINKKKVDHNIIYDVQCPWCTTVKHLRISEVHTNKSCGCMTKYFQKTKNYRIRHKNKRLYSIWYGMKERCYNNNNVNYQNYGERGIKLCTEWLDYFNFYKWSMDNGYKGDLSIDRIDVNGNYEPSNCRWANDTEQQYNKRNNIRYKIRDKLLTNADVMEILGVSWDCLRRIRRQYDIHVIEMLLEDKLK